MTTPAQQLQEETIKDLKERLERGEYTVEQVLRMAYILGARALMSALGGIEENCNGA